MATVTINPGTLVNYRNTSVSQVEQTYLGYVAGDANYLVRLTINPTKKLKSLRVKMTWPYATNVTLNTFRAALTQTAGTTPPSSGYVSFNFTKDGEADVTLNQEIAAGTWYLWLWTAGTNGGFVRGTPTWTITGETAGGVVKVKYGGEVKEAVPKVYKNGEWKTLSPRAYKSGAWKEMS